MELHIENGASARDVQGQFNALYPFLQLEFFEVTDTKTKRRAKAQPDQPLQRWTPRNQAYRIPVSGDITVANLLKDLNRIGLAAQVCRKSGNHWIETTLTDDWTLERQNREALLVETFKHR